MWICNLHLEPHLYRSKLRVHAIFSHMLSIPQREPNAFHSTKGARCFPFHKGSQMLSIPQREPDAFHSTKGARCFPFHKESQMLSIPEREPDAFHSTKEPFVHCPKIQLKQRNNNSNKKKHKFTGV